MTEGYEVLEKFNVLSDGEKNTLLLVLISTYNVFNQVGLDVHSTMSNMFRFTDAMEKMYPGNVDLLKKTFGEVTPEGAGNEDSKAE
jgi:hypothetical protein